MTSTEDEAICIRHWDFSETSQTVGLFSRTHGLIRAIAKGSRRERGGFSGGVDLIFGNGDEGIIPELGSIITFEYLKVFIHTDKDGTKNAFIQKGLKNLPALTIKKLVEKTYLNCW